MAKLNTDWTGDWSHMKKASWYKLIWCKLRHAKKIQDLSSMGWKRCKSVWMYEV